MIIAYISLNGSTHEVDTAKQIDFVLDREKSVDLAVCTINGVEVTEDVYESVMAQLRSSLE